MFREFIQSLREILSVVRLQRRIRTYPINRAKRRHKARHPKYRDGDNHA